MLKKYLQFLIDSFEKLTSLGGSNSTWNDYFLTVGNEFLVILIGLAYIVAIFLIVYIPIFGNKKLIRGIRKKDNWYRFYNLYEKYTEAVLKIKSIVSNIEQNEDVRILNEYAYNDHLVKELIETLNKFGIQIPGVNFKKGDKFDKELLNNTLKEFNLQSRLPMEEISKHKWDNCGDFTEFNIFGERPLTQRLQHSRMLRHRQFRTRLTLTKQKLMLKPRLQLLRVMQMQRSLRHRQKLTQTRRSTAQSLTSSFA